MGIGRAVLVPGNELVFVIIVIHNCVRLLVGTWDDGIVLLTSDRSERLTRRKFLVGRSAWVRLFLLASGGSLGRSETLSAPRFLGPGGHSWIGPSWFRQCDQPGSRSATAATQGCRMCAVLPPFHLDLHLTKCFSAFCSASPGKISSLSLSYLPTPHHGISDKARTAPWSPTCTPVMRRTKPFLNAPQTRPTSSDGSCTGP